MLVGVAGLDPQKIEIAYPAALQREHEQNSRRYAQVDPTVPLFEFARSTRALPLKHRVGLYAHEIGHVLVPWEDEDGADDAARRVLGVTIGYDRRWPGKGLQYAVTVPPSISALLAASGC